MKRFNILLVFFFVFSVVMAQDSQTTVKEDQKICGLKSSRYDASEVYSHG